MKGDYLNLGCGPRKLSFAINLDNRVEVSPDIVCDATQGLPFPDNTFKTVIAYDFLEHIPIGKTIFVVSEIWRVLLPKGLLKHRTPSTDGRGAFQDPTHRCYSTDTEVLTKDGWKLISNTNIGEDVLTIDPATLLSTYQKVIQKHEYKFNGNMIHFKTDCMDLLVTPNHKMLSKPSGVGGKWRLRVAEEFYGLSNKSNIFYQKVLLKNPSRVTDEIEIPNYYNGMGWKCKLRYPSVPFMQLMGWFISEGGIHIESNSLKSRHNTYRIDIYQSKRVNKEKCKLIWDTLVNLGETPFWGSNGNAIAFCNKGLALFLQNLGNSYTKFIPTWIKQQNPILLKYLLDAALLGDGSKNGKSGWSYASVSKKLADDIAEVAQLCGYRATQSVEKRGYYAKIFGKEYFCRDIHLVYISKRECLYAQTKKVRYDGNVVSLGVKKYHTIFVRRNGRAVWSGNSFWNINSWLYYMNDEYRDLYGIKAKFGGENRDQSDKTNTVIHTVGDLWAIK